MSKELSERKKIILHALVDSYITTGQPVSSADIQKSYLSDVSSATIRAELSALEALGYIEQPHTSAGRVPLKPAYKFYVSELKGGVGGMLTDAETAFIRREFTKKLTDVEDISKQAAKIISDVTNYTSFCVEKINCESIEIEEIQLVPLKKGKVVVLIITDKGMLANKAIDVEENVKSEYIQTANSVLNKVFSGKHISEIRDIEAYIDEEIKGFRNIFDEVLDIIKTYMVEHSEDNVVVEGALKMLDYPEYNNVDDAKNFLSVISNKDSVVDILASEEESIEFSIKIGKEDSGVDKCAIITASYKVGDQIRGQAGVIGPERMDYKKVLNVLDYVKKAMASVIDSGHQNRLEGKNNNEDNK